MNLAFEMFANMDAFSLNYDRILQRSCAAYSPTFYDVGQGNYPNSRSPFGTFLLQKLTNSYVQVAFSPSGNLDFGGTAAYYRFQLNYRRFNFGATCTISNVIAEFSTTSSTPGSGVNNTLNPGTLSCTDDNLVVQFDNKVFGSVWAGADGKYNPGMYTILYITIAGSNQDFPIDNLDWVPIMGNYFYYWSGNWHDSACGWQVYNTALPPSLATTATLATTANNRGGYVELSFYLGNLATTIGSDSGKILLVDFISSSTWTSGANDPFNSYSTTAAVFQIECQCYSGIGPLTLSSTTPFASVKCYRRLPQAPQNSFAIAV